MPPTNPLSGISKAALTLAVAACLAHANPDPPAAPEDSRQAVSDERIELAITRGVAFLQAMQRRDGRWVTPGLEERYPNAVTALTAFALRVAGTPASDWGLQKVAKAFADRSRTRTSFARGLTLLMWCALDPEQHQRQIAEDVKYLQRKQLPGGGWGDAQPGEADGKDAPPITADPVTTQLAFQALAKAARTGANVHVRTWRREEELWETGMLADGGWGAASRNGSPSATAEERLARVAATAAGIASLQTLYDHRYLDAALAFNGRFKARCGKVPEKTKAIRGAIENGWAWMSTQFPIAVGPDGALPDVGEQRLASQAYTWYAVVRAAVLSGHKRIGKHVWREEIARELLWRQQVDGSWGSIYDTCFAVLTLRQLAAPVVLSKLAWHGDDLWHRDPRDAANLTRRWSRELAMPVTWQVLYADSSGDMGDVFDAPVLLMTGHEAPTFSEGWRSGLREYVHAGGTVLCVACCSRMEFLTGCRELFSDLLPDLDHGPLGEDHPIWSCRNAIEPGERMTGLSDGCRTRVFLLGGGACCAWQQDLVEDYPRFFQLAGNVIAYATFDRPPRGRVTPYLRRTSTLEVRAARVAGRPRPDSSELTIARLKHSGDWWIDPTALPRLGDLLSSRAAVNLRRAEPIRADKARRAGVDLLWLTGHTFEPLSPGRRVALKAYLAAGGTLVATACCGRETFDTPFRAFAQTLFGKEAWRRIDRDDALLTGAFAPDLATELSAVLLRSRFGTPPPGRPDWANLYGVKHKGRWVVIYSPYDMNCGLAGHNCLRCTGYRPADAEAIATNIALYIAGSTRQDREPNASDEPRRDRQEAE